MRRGDLVDAKASETADVNYFSMAQEKPSFDKLTAQPKAPDTAFDVWLNRGLHQLFDDVANEPVPDELLKLIQDDQKK